MAYGIYVTINGVRRQYPLVEIDGDAMVNDDRQRFDTISITPAAPDSSETERTGFYGYTISPLEGFGYFTDPIVDPRSADQVVYWAEDNEKDCFEVVTLTDEPDDWTATGLDDVGVGTLRVVNPLYYTYSTGYADQYVYTRASTTFSAGTYLKNTTCNALIQTEKDYFMACCCSKAYDGWGLDHKWYWQFGQLSDQGWLSIPQYNYFDPYQDIGWNTSPSNMTELESCDHELESPPTPTDLVSCFCRVTLSDHEYIGVMFGTISNGEINTCRLYLMPAWMWGEVTPYNPEPPEPVIPDPHDYGNDSWSDGGGGTLADSNDAPSAGGDEQIIGGSLSQSYGMHIYRVGADKYDVLMQALYGSGADWTALWSRWQNYKYSPLSGIVSSHYIPYHLCYASAVTANIRLCGVSISDTSSIVMNNYQVHTTTIGTLSIPEFFGTAHDYNPHTRMRLFLPYCGWIDIDPDRVAGGSITIKYKTDCASGDCCAYVICTDRTGSDTYMYTITGNCAVSLPIAGNDQGTGSVIGGIMSAAASAVSGNIIGIATGAASALTAKHTQQISGKYGGSTGLISDHQCRLQIIRPCPSIPKYGQQLRGRPSDVGVTVSQLIGTGWNSFSAVHADIDGATQAECEEIVRLMRDGIIL